MTDVAARLGVSVSTAHRLLGMLVYRDFAEQLPDLRYAPRARPPPWPGAAGIGRHAARRRPAAPAEAGRGGWGDEHLDTVRHAYDLPADALDWRGPVAPDEDPLWTDMQSGRITEPAYWEQRAAEFDELTGAGGLRVLMKVMYDGADSHETDLIRPLAARAVDKARAAGVKVGVLTNDLSAFHSAAWVERMTLFGQLDGLVDAGVDGVCKPAAAYELIARRLGVRPEDAVYVDDQPTNVLGARRAGMHAVFLDVSNPDESYRQALAALGLD